MSRCAHDVGPSLGNTQAGWKERTYMSRNDCKDTGTARQMRRIPSESSRQTSECLVAHGRGGLGKGLWSTLEVGSDRSQSTQGIVRCFLVFLLKWERPCENKHMKRGQDHRAGLAVKRAETGTEQSQKEIFKGRV